MKGEHEVNIGTIHSEITHEQEVSLTHSPPLREVIDRIRCNLESVEERLKTSKNEE